MYQDNEFGRMTEKLSEFPSVMLSGDICRHPTKYHNFPSTGQECNYRTITRINNDQEKKGQENRNSFKSRVSDKLQAPLFLITLSPLVPDSLSTLVSETPRSPVLNSPKIPGMDVQTPKTSLQDFGFEWITAKLSEFLSVMLSGDICRHPT